MKECRKENIEYKVEGIKAIGPILETHQLDRFQEISDILYPHLREVSTKASPRKQQQASC